MTTRAPKLSRRVTRVGQAVLVKLTSYGRPQVGLELAPVIAGGQRTGAWQITCYEWTAKGRWIVHYTHTGSRKAMARRFVREVKFYTRQLAA